MLEALERKLSYDDLRFYRSIARSQLRKDMATRRKVEEERKKQQPQKQNSWGSWIWGSGSGSASTAPDKSNPAPSSEELAFTGEMTEEQRKELYAALDYDEKAALAESLDTPKDALKARVNAQLNRGSFALKTDPHGKNSEIVSIVFDIFQATFVQRQDNFETSLSLGGFAVRDGTTQNTAYPLIVHVQEKRSQSEIVKALPIEEKGARPGLPDPFFFLKFESNPLDGRADSALIVRMRYMEIVYHKGYIEAVYKFLKPPASQLESVEALLVGHNEFMLYVYSPSLRMSQAKHSTACGKRLELVLSMHCRRTRRSTCKWTSTRPSSSSQKSKAAIRATSVRMIINSVPLSASRPRSASTSSSMRVISPSGASLPARKLSRRSMRNGSSNTPKRTTSTWSR